VSLHASIVIPTLNAGMSLGHTLESLKQESIDGTVEIIVVDGGSDDATVAVATEFGARVLRAPRGRGQQLARAAAEASGEWLLFLHADTAPEPGWSKALAVFAAAPEHAKQAAVFRFALDDPSPAARRLERIVAWRTKVMAMPYGDQGLFLSRDFYRALGGYRPLPLYEDVDLIRRIGQRRLVALNVRAVTSAVRYRGPGYPLRSARNLCCLALYYLGVSPGLIARYYGG
jgi:rSAM/selenodomain-associated transferase 2